MKYIFRFAFITLFVTGIATPSWSEVIGMNPEIGQIIHSKTKTIPYLDVKGNKYGVHVRIKEKLIIISYNSGQVRGKGEVIGSDGKGKSFSSNTRNVEGYRHLDSYLDHGWTVKNIVPVESASPDSVVAFVVLEAYEIIHIGPLVPK